ncbi:MAG TPA: 1-deoxy-D-xylulose-5-phosphate reductoisomerase [Steroidobacteraceae bacterium]|nr:1-deoxy-D-xylulose-5-phosphate reductoisomerase [Steroidobacteraceae bacterium]
MIGVAILGSTGSIGESTLDVLNRHAAQFRVVALAAGRNVDRLAAQCERYRPDYAALTDAGAARELDQRLKSAGLPTQVLQGPDSLEQLARLPEVAYVMAAIVGAAGLRSTLAAARAGKRLLLANKESLVMAGPLVLEAVREGGATLIPIDSEHNAIFQCLPSGSQVGSLPPAVRRLILTASGGPFLDWPVAQLAAVTPEQACAHPNWVMGRKISVDSATLMNKGLELIEACALFGLPPERLEIIVHPQSIVHSMVEYLDGSVLAQLGSPDMRTPIAQALAWPQRFEAGVQSLDLVKLGRLEFRAPDPLRFPCLRLAPEAIRAGGVMPAVLNAANEVAVQAFLDRRLNFLDIPAVIEAVMDGATGGSATDLDAVLAADRSAREAATAAVKVSAGSRRSALA